MGPLRRQKMTGPVRRCPADAGQPNRPRLTRINPDPVRLDFPAFAGQRADLGRKRIALIPLPLTCVSAPEWSAASAPTPGGEAEYYFRLGIRDQREIYIERGTRVQSFGGIQ